MLLFSVSGQFATKSGFGIFLLFPPQPFHDQQRDAVILWNCLFENRHFRMDQPNLVSKSFSSDFSFSSSGAYVLC